MYVLILNISGGSRRNQSGYAPPSNLAMDFGPPFNEEKGLAVYKFVR